jgi:glycosyltransferase involved in cell wall biosynthesis
VDILIEALGLLSTRMDPLPLLVAAGKGPLREDLERRAAELGIAERVRFVGKVPHDEVAEYMSVGDVFVLPSYSEGLPTVACEALNCGVPIVATAVDGTPEVVRDGETGLLVPAGDAPALADALERILTDDDLRRRLAEQAVIIGREEFTWDANARQSVRLYEGVIG